MPSLWTPCMHFMFLWTTNSSGLSFRWQVQWIMQLIVGSALFSQASILCAVVCMYIPQPIPLWLAAQNCSSFRCYQSSDHSPSSARSAAVSLPQGSSHCKTDLCRLWAGIHLHSNCFWSCCLPHLISAKPWPEHIWEGGFVWQEETMTKCASWTVWQNILRPLFFCAFYVVFLNCLTFGGNLSFEILY